MPFPWGQSTLLDITFTCPHCGDVKIINQGSVAVCDCPGSEKAEAENRERAASHRRSQEDARKVSMVEARRRRREARKDGS